MGFLMELDDKYKPFLDFIDEHQFSIFLLKGSTDEEFNVVSFYLPDLVKRDKDEHKLYVEFTLPNTVIDQVVEYQQQLEDLCASSFR